MTTTKEIGRIFLEKRQELELSLDEASKRSKIHPNVISDIEGGVFDKLGSVYVRSFLKKYSSFLGIDPDFVMKKYESISRKIPSREFNLKELEESEGKEKPSIIPALSGKKVQIAVIASLSVILVILLFVLVAVIKSAVIGPSKAERITPEKKVRTVQKAKKAPEAAKPAETKPKSLTSVVKEAITKPAPKEAVTLTLKARDEVWVQLKEGDKKIFDGILKNGDSKTWKADGPITVWTGKADKLDFIVNTRNVGVVAAGVVKNIKVSSEGVQIGNTWAARIR